jgi:pyruvate dehydrogenase (quinone)
MQDCDTLLTVGSNFPYTQFLPDLDQARAVQIDIDGSFIGMRYPYKVNLVGDATTTLRALIPLLERKQDRSWQDLVIESVERWWEVMGREAHVAAGRDETVNPMRLFSEFSAQAPHDAMIAADSGSAANWYARQIRMRGTMRGTLSGTLATMGPAVPYAIGAKFAHPDRPAIAFEGDGAMQMNGLAELITISRYWPEWTDPRLVIAVLHNNDLNQVTWELRAMGGTPKFVESQALPDVSYAEFATSVGLGAITITDPDELAGAWKTALAADRPYVLDVHCDPDIPPIPPHATLDQMTASAKALIKGDPSRWGVLKEGIKTKAQELLPGGDGT